MSTSSTPQPTAGALAGDAIHHDWVAKYRTPEAQPFYELAFDDIVRRLHPAPGDTILDAGCGSCAKSVLLAARGLRVMATDFSAEALGLAAGTVKAHGFEHSIQLQQADLTKLQFRDGEFPFIICWGVLMHVPDLEAALSELARVLAPGGRLVLSEGNVHSLQSKLLRAATRLLGRGRGRVIAVPSGLESHEETAQGRLVTRQTDMRWLEAEGRRLGLRLETRVAGQLTELYTLAPWRWLRRLIHAVNNAWFTYVKLPGPAFGNILVFEKVDTARR